MDTEIVIDLDFQKDQRHWKSKTKTNKTVCLNKNYKPCLENGRLLNQKKSRYILIDLKTNMYTEVNPM